MAGITVTTVIWTSYPKRRLVPCWPELLNTPTPKASTMGSTKVTDEKLQQVVNRMPPCTLPYEAYGPQELEWPVAGNRPVVNAWITWPNGAATRVEAVAHGWNDRVVVVQWTTNAGDVQCVVWRNAVTRR